MKIAYLIDYDPCTNNGVMQKIYQQSLQWTKKDHTVYLVSTKTMSVYDADQNIILQEKPLNVKLGRIGTAINLLYNSYFTYKLFENIEIDMIYMRYRLYMPFINKIFKNHRVIMEINSDDTLEYKLHSQLTHRYNSMTRAYFLKHIDAFVSVSYELKKKFEYFNKPIEVIGNGIEYIEYIEYKEYGVVKREFNKVPIFVFIGTPNQSWHGLDKIIMMAEHFKEYRFYIIGSDGEDSQNIQYFGYLTKEESTRIINQCDIGIGTLSLYETGLTEASPLKSRQYLACGLPLIYAYTDTDIPNDVEFGLRLENTENNMDYQKIDNFIQNVFNNKSISLNARKFSEEILGYDKKEEVRLIFFKRVVDEK